MATVSQLERIEITFTADGLPLNVIAYAVMKDASGNPAGTVVNTFDPASIKASGLLGTVVQSAQVQCDPTNGDPVAAQDGADGQIKTLARMLSVRVSQILAGS